MGYKVIYTHTQNPILGTTITVERLQKRGYIPLAEMYQ